MLDYLPVGPHGDPVLDFSQLTRSGRSARRSDGQDFVDGGGENARELRRMRIKLANRINALELLGKHYKLYADPHEQDFGSAGLAARFE